MDGPISMCIWALLIRLGGLIKRGRELVCVCVWPWEEVQGMKNENNQNTLCMGMKLSKNTFKNIMLKR